jgi:hypothetical protein
MRAGLLARSRVRRIVLSLACAVCLAGMAAACGGVPGVPGGHSGTPVAQPTSAAQTCRTQQPNYAYHPGDAMAQNPYLRCVMTALIGKIGSGTASLAYLVETFKNCNPGDKQSVAGWTLYQQDPTQPKVTTTPGKFTGVGPSAPLFTADSPTRKGCFSGVVAIVKNLVGVPLPGNVTLDQLRSGVLIFNEDNNMYNVSVFLHPSLIVSIGQHLSHCPCDIQQLDFLPADPAFLGTSDAPGQVALEARLVYLA